MTNKIKQDIKSRDGNTNLNATTINIYMNGPGGLSPTELKNISEEKIEDSNHTISFQKLQNSLLKAKENIFKAFNKKILNNEPEKLVNFRVTRDVFFNGSLSEEDICAEYYGGVLASSRSEDGKNDNGIHYTETIKSLSSQQLHLHYIIYNLLNKRFNKNFKKSNRSINVGLGEKIESESLYLNFYELKEKFNMNYLEADLQILQKQKLISNFRTDFIYDKGEKKGVYYIKVNPTTFGVLLYSIAHNKFEIWKNFSSVDFGDLEDIGLPEFSSISIQDLFRESTNYFYYSK